MKGEIFQIQRYCLHDGPGIRTVVFLQGCPLRCRWCHNPESHSCARHAVGGQTLSVGQVLAEVQKDEIFYRNSGGGITLSGGEPLVQAEFAYALLHAAKQSGIHTCIETCGYAPTEQICKLAEVTDLFLYDWKLTDPHLHASYTGADNRLIAQNLDALSRIGAKIILRCPIVPTVNDNESHFCGIAEAANAFAGILAVQVEPYHPLGDSKYKKLGIAETAHIFPVPSQEQASDWVQQIAQRTAIAVSLA